MGLEPKKIIFFLLIGHKSKSEKGKLFLLFVTMQNKTATIKVVAAQKRVEIYFFAFLFWNI